MLSRLLTMCAVVAMLLASAPRANAQADVDFRAFLGNLKTEALAFGITDATFARAFAGIEPDRTLPDLVLPGQTKVSGAGQAEFVKTPLEYLNVSSLLGLAAQGRNLATQHAATLQRIESELGVERQIVLAIWGRETAYGQYQLKHHVIRVLATQAYLGRRKDMFRTELLHALKMIQDDVLDPARMKASWAGALGLTQFMPSEYATLAVDLDRDGRKDIWTSVPDALASAANQLKAKGWTKGQPWAIEVRLPADPGCLHEGLPNARPVSEWVRLGITRADGKAFDAVRLAEQAFIVTPGGAYGPAFLAFENFMVLKRYNFADLYAVFVGHLADRLSGGGDFVAKWTTPKMISTRDIEAIQVRLRDQGFAIEKIDGKAGMNTRNTIGQYQKKYGLAINCWPSAELLAHVRGSSARAGQPAKTKAAP